MADDAGLDGAAAVLFVLPQGLTVTGVNTWAIAVARELRNAGRHAGVLTHGNLEGHQEVSSSSDVLDRIDLPSVEEIVLEDDVRRLGEAYLKACRPLADQSGAPCIIVPTRHDACFAGAAWVAVHEPDVARLVLWQQVDSAYEDALMTHHEPAASVLVGASGYLTQALRDRLPHRATDVACVPNAVNTPKDLPIREAVARRPVQLLYLGRLEQEQKRVGSLLTMSAELDRRGVMHTLRIAGDGVARSHLERGANGRSIQMLGVLDRAGVNSELARADALVLPSRHEGLSFAVLEAMASGCAIVLARPRSGCAEAVEHGVSGWIVDVDEDEHDVGTQLARGVMDAVGVGLPALGAAAQHRVAERFSMASHVERFAAVCDRASCGRMPTWPVGRRLLARGPSEQDRAAGERLSGLLAADRTRWYVVHGVGAHTRRMSLAIEAAGDRVLAFTDDDPTTWGRTCLGRPVVAPADVAGIGATDVVISSDLHESTIWRRRHVYEAQGLRVHRLYGQ